MKKNIFLVLFLGLYVLPAFSVPAFRAKRVVNVNGESVELTLTGDEYFHYYLSDDNRAFRQTNDGRFFPISEQELTALKVSGADARCQANARRSLKARSPQHKVNYTGQKKGLVILVEFADVKFSSSDDPHTFYSKFFNQPSYTENGFTGSVHDYFYDQSYGQFDLEFDVVGPLEAKHQMAYYGQNSEDGNRKDVMFFDFVEEVLEMADEHVNYKDYDWDGNREADQVFIIYAGYGENYGADPNTLWPKEASLTANGVDVRYDGVQIGAFACSCELSGTKGNTPDGIGSACHEFTHCLGIPDMYDTGYSGGVGMAYWDVMCSGSYLNNSRTPAGYTSYERWMSGWLNPVEITNFTQVTGMPSLEVGPIAYVLYNEGNRDEYYLLENRQPTKWDAYVGGHGLLVVHVDYDKGAWTANNVNTTVNRQRMTVIPADGRLGSGNNSSGDTYPGTTGKTSLNSKTNPAASVYNKNTDGSNFMHKNLDSITEEDGVISFIACRPDPGTPVLKELQKVSNTSFTASWDGVDNVDSYTVFLTEIPQITHDKEANLLLEEDFGACYARSAGFTDIGGSLDKYTSQSGWAGSKLYCTPNYLRVGTSSATGSISTPWLDPVSSGEATFVISLQLFDQKTPVEGTIRFVPSGQQNTSYSFTIDHDQLIVVNVSNINIDFRFGFYPNSRVYINHIYVYEGIWTLEELTSNNVKALRKISEKELNVEGTSYTFADMTPTSTYRVKVRANTIGNFSDWSEEKSILLDPTAIEDVPAEVTSSSESGWYDLQGRQVALPVRRGLYIHEGRKVVR